MKASLLLLAALTVISIAPANARPLQRSTDMTITSDPLKGCNISAGAGFSAIPCRNYYNLKSVDECQSKLRDLGWDRNTLWWYCGNLGLNG